MKASELIYLLKKYDLKDNDEVVFQCSIESQRVIAHGTDDSVSLLFVDACRIECNGDAEKVLRITLDVHIDHENHDN